MILAESCPAHSTCRTAPNIPQIVQRKGDTADHTQDFQKAESVQRKMTGHPGLGSGVRGKPQQQIQSPLRTTGQAHLYPLVLAKQCAAGTK